MVMHGLKTPPAQYTALVRALLDPASCVWCSYRIRLVVTRCVRSASMELCCFALDAESRQTSMGGSGRACCTMALCAQPADPDIAICRNSSCARRI